jgi:tetratricopeptide (TPR) repeat protein
MIRAGRWASAADVERFQVSAEAAASLDHASIVPIYDVGVHDCQPYLSMKLIEGGSLAERIRGTPQPPREAAKLVAQVARAVDFAHQRGILHRDLKPANVLLDTEGRPFLTDFGLAKWVNRDQDLTPSGITVGTPSYMAPEQAFPARVRTGNGPADSGAGLTTRADVYGLGAVLFELLTGRPPFKGETALDTLLEVLEKPATPPRGLSPALDRDLEIVCLKCLEKDPSRRYATAADLADDLERYVRGEPISARPSGMLERTWRRIRRQPVVSALLLALGLSLVGGVGAVTMEWRRAEDNLADARAQKRQADQNAAAADEQRDKAEKHAAALEIQRKETDREHTALVQEYGLFRRAVSELCQRATQVTGSESLKRSLLTGAVPYFEGFVKRHGHDPIVESNLALTYLFLGELSAEAGAIDEALQSYEKARGVLEWLLANHASDQHRGNLATVHYRIAVLLTGKGLNDEAARNLLKTCTIAEPLCNRAQPDLENLSLVASAWNRRAYLHFDAKEYARAEECYARNVALMEEVVRLGSDKPDHRRKIADGILNVAHARGLQGRRDEAHAMYCKAVDAFRPLLATTNPVSWHVNAHNALEHTAGTGPGRAAMLGEIAASHRRTGHAYLNAKQYLQALARYREARKAADEWAKKDGESVEPRSELAKCHYDMAVVLDRLGEPEEAVRHLETARDLRLPLVEREPKRPDLRYDLGLTFTSLAEKLEYVGRHHDALSALRDGAEQYRLALNGPTPRGPSRLALAANLLAQAGLERRSGRLGAAEAALAERRQLLQDQPQELYATAREFAALALFATGGKGTPSPEEEANRRRYAGLAVATLREAIACGYKDVDRARTDAAFAPLRRLPEFNALVTKP